MMRKAPCRSNFALDVLYSGEQPRSQATPCIVGEHIKFNDDAMQKYRAGSWDPLIYDVMILVAGVEICDRSKVRPTARAGRNLKLRIPVHEPERWQDANVKSTLLDALSYLTCDHWSIDFRKTDHPQSGPSQKNMYDEHPVGRVIPYSDGLDSRAIDGISKHKYDNELIMQLRVGSNRIKKREPGEPRQPFVNVPFNTKKVISGNRELSALSRGFKFAVFAGLAAYLYKAPKIIVPESGQGTLGPILANSGSRPYDRRNHPAFTKRISDFLRALFGTHIIFEHPVIFKTKGQTLADYKALYPDVPIWDKTRSCWMDQRHASVNGKHRQCGICASCMLRRVSLHAAGYQERADTYLWENLGAETFTEGANPGLRKPNCFQLQYGLAGTLHMDHLAALKDDSGLEESLRSDAVHLAIPMGLPADDVTTRLIRMIETHASEWSAFLGDLPEKSFVRSWAESA